MSYAEKAKAGLVSKKKKNEEENKKNERFEATRRRFFSSSSSSSSSPSSSPSRSSNSGRSEEEEERETTEGKIAVFADALAEKIEKEARVNEEVENEGEEVDTTCVELCQNERGEEEEEEEEEEETEGNYFLTAKLLGDTHYAYGSFGYGYYTSLPDGTAIFTPAFVPPPVAVPMMPSSSWGYEHLSPQGGIVSPPPSMTTTTTSGVPLQQQQHFPKTMTTAPSEMPYQLHPYYQYQPYSEEVEGDQQYYLQMPMAPPTMQTPSELGKDSTISASIASASENFASLFGDATAATFSSFALPPMSDRDAARAGKLRMKNRNGADKKINTDYNINNISRRDPMINYTGGGNSINGNLSLGESVRGPRFRNPECILSLGSPYKSLHEKLNRPNPHEIFAGIDWSACKGFVCKSFSEDDIHKSIKYGKWSSTPRGNAKLSEAFQQQQQLYFESRNGGSRGGNCWRARISGGEEEGGSPVISNSGSKSSEDMNGGAANENRSIVINSNNETALSSSPLKNTRKGKKKIPQRILLLFSVNASGYFSGVAEMTSDVDFDKNETFWQREGKFNGSFDVEWLVAKDVPFHVFGRHLRIVDDRKIHKVETKKVTHSRDAQHVTPTVLRQCIEVMLAYQTENGLAKDFEFYDERERIRYESRKLNASSRDRRTTVSFSPPKSHAMSSSETTSGKKNKLHRSSSGSTNTKTTTTNTTTTTVVS